MTKRSTWSKIVEESGIQVRIFERTRGGLIYRSVIINGRKNRKSLGHRDKKLAEQQAKHLARSIAELQMTGGYAGRVTIGHLFRLYLHHKAPLLSADRRQWAESRIPLFTAAWGDGFDVTSLSQTQVDRYCAARRAGTLTPLKPVTDEAGATKGRRPVKVKDGTLDGDFRWLSSCLNWARSFKVDGRRLLPENPLHDVNWPREKNVRRPVASHDRFVRTLEQASIIDPRGRLACILTLARYTGRRAEAICSLRASDVLLTRDQAARTLASMGRDESRAETWLHGAIRWRAENDKQGFDEIAPLGTAARRAVDDYLALEPRMGDVPLFPAERGSDSPMRRDVASRWLLKAEKLAKLPKLEHGVFHCYRRLWAMERKDLPDVDVAAAGGWRDTRALKQSYQQADAATMMRVVEAS